MKIMVSSKYFDLYLCNGHYDIHEDAMARNGFNFRIHKIVYSKGKGWRKLNFLKTYQNIRFNNSSSSTS